VGRRSPELAVNPRVLVWARESAGVTPDEAAKRAHRVVEDFEAWEQGEARPTVSALRELAKLYRRPLAALLLPEPRPTPVPADFRAGDKKGKLSRDTLLSLRRAVRLREIAHELDGGEQRLQLGSTGSAQLTASSAEEAAVEERTRLRISREAQSGWSDYYEAFRVWRGVVEELGILVFQMHMPVDEVRGFSLSEETPAAIVLNSADFVGARIFTLFHEYGHLLLGRGGICFPESDQRPTPNEREIERFCNRFAGAFLIPKDELLNGSLVASLATERPYPSDAMFNPLTSRYRVSRQVIWYRLRHLGLISDGVFRAKWDEWMTQPKPKRSSGGGGLSSVDRCLSERGTRFASMVVEAERRGVLDFADAIDSLGIRAGAYDALASAVT
jgi:Zn-dependent peptidase ImmA (M78 family)